MVLAAGLLIGAALSGAVFVFVTGDRSLARVREADGIRIGYAVEAPYAFLGKDGAVTGESPEVANRVAARLGASKVTWRQVEFGSLIPELEAGSFDVIAAGMFITPDRARQVSFSRPTFHVRQGLLVLKGNPRQLHSYRQAVDIADVKLAAISGAVEERLLRDMGLRAPRLVPVPDALTGRVSVESGVVDGLALSSPTVQWMAMEEQLGSTEVAQPFEEPDQARASKLGYGAFAFRKEDRALRAAWDAELGALIGSPEHRALVARFGFREAELPGTTSTAEILSR